MFKDWSITFQARPSWWGLAWQGLATKLDRNHADPSWESCLESCHDQGDKNLDLHKVIHKLIDTNPAMILFETENSYLHVVIVSPCKQLLQALCVQEGCPTPTGHVAPFKESQWSQQIMWKYPLNRRPWSTCCAASCRKLCARIKNHHSRFCKRQSGDTQERQAPHRRTVLFLAIIQLSRQILLETLEK